MLENLLKTLCKELSISPIPSPDKQNVYTLRFIDDVEIRLRDLEPGVYLTSRLATCPEKKREDLFLYLMRANVLGQGTGGSGIGLSANEKMLTLILELPYEMSYSTFREKMEDFINYTVYLRKQITQFESKA